MTNNLTAKDIVKLMDENNITIQDIADEKGVNIWVWSIEDVIARIDEQNEKYGNQMSEELKTKIAREVLDRLDFSDYGELYDTIDFAFDELIYEVKEEFEQEDEGE